MQSVFQTNVKGKQTMMTLNKTRQARVGKVTPICEEDNKQTYCFDIHTYDICVYFDAGYIAIWEDMFNTVILNGKTTDIKFDINKTVVIDMQKVFTQKEIDALYNNVYGVKQIRYYTDKAMQWYINNVNKDWLCEEIEKVGL